MASKKRGPNKKAGKPTGRTQRASNPPAKKTTRAEKPPAKKRSSTKTFAPGRKRRSPTFGLAAARRELIFIATAKSKSATNLGLSVDGSTLDMEQDGDTWTGQKSVTVGDAALIKFRVAGLDTTAWNVQVDIDCSNGPSKVLSRKGVIGTPGGAGFDENAPIKPNPCG